MSSIPFLLWIFFEFFNFAKPLTEGGCFDESQQFTYYSDTDIGHGISNYLASTVDAIT